MKVTIEQIENCLKNYAESTTSRVDYASTARRLLSVLSLHRETLEPQTVTVDILYTIVEQCQLHD